jgi:molybdopterin/thiamine biosynthesis adenylyltransferase
MDHNQLLRYSRQILLPEFGIDGQERLLASRVLIIGLGGLGSPVAMYLAAAGVGRLVLVDDDTVDLSNLQRQVAHGNDDIGRPKVESARDSIQRLNPDIAISPITQRLAGEALLEQVRAADVVVDACDNFATRFAVNAACVETRTPLVSGAAIRMEGQVAVFRPDLDDSPCYRCLYKDEGELDQACSDNGVLAPLVGVIGSLQAVEAIKVLTGAGESAHGRLLLFDARTTEWRSIRLRKDPACPVCSRR